MPLLALQSAKKPHAAYNRVRTCGNRDAHGMLLTSRFRNSCRSAPFPDPGLIIRRSSCKELAAALLAYRRWPS
jgi:hypothetical protein